MPKTATLCKTHPPLLTYSTPIYILHPYLHSLPLKKSYVPLISLSGGHTAGLSGRSSAPGKVGTSAPLDEKLKWWRGSCITDPSSVGNWLSSPGKVNCAWAEQSGVREEIKANFVFPREEMHLSYWGAKR